MVAVGFPFGDSGIPACHAIAMCRSPPAPGQCEAVTPRCSRPDSRQYGIDRGLGGGQWRPPTTMPGVAYCRLELPNVDRRQAADIQDRREFAENAPKTEGQIDGDHGRRDQSLVPQRHVVPGDHEPAAHVRLRRQTGGGWSALRRPGKLRPQTGWAPIAFALDWNPSARQRELHLLLVFPHRPVALTETSMPTHYLSPARQAATKGSPDRLQRVVCTRAWAGCRLGTALPVNPLACRSGAS